MTEHKRCYRLVAVDGVASKAELQADYDAALRKRREQFGAAPSTIEAVVYELRTFGLAALAGANCQRRLAELNREQVGEIIVRLHRLRGRDYCPGVTDDLLLFLGGNFDEA